MCFPKQDKRVCRLCHGIGRLDGHQRDHQERLRMLQDAHRTRLRRLEREVAELEAMIQEQEDEDVELELMRLETVMEDIRQELAEDIEAELELSRREREEAELEATRLDMEWTGAVLGI